MSVPWSSTAWQWSKMVVQQARFVVMCVCAAEDDAGACQAITACPRRQMPGVRQQEVHSVQLEGVRRKLVLCERTANAEGGRRREGKGLVQQANSKRLWVQVGRGEEAVRALRAVDKGQGVVWVLLLCSVHEHRQSGSTVLCGVQWKEACGDDDGGEEACNNDGGGA